MHTHPPRVRIRRGGRFRPAGLALLATVAAACGPTAQAGEPGTSLPETTVVADDYRFEVPDIEAGPVRLRLDNVGQEAHHAQLFALHDGVDVDDLQAALAAEDDALLAAMGSFAGGTGTVSPGQDSWADGIVELSAGAYAFVCFIPAADGMPHVGKGMLELFEVQPRADDNPSPTMSDEQEGTIELLDFTFALPAPQLSRGTYRVTNQGAELHELNILQLVGSATADEAVDFLLDPDAAGGPPPFTSIGGTQALMPGGVGSQSVLLDLPPGQYAFVCFVPGADGIPHVAKGMVTQVTVED